MRGWCRFHVYAAFASLLIACSTVPTPIVSAPVAEAPDPRSRLRALQPEGPALSDIRALFTGDAAPPRAELDQCDFDYQVEHRLGGGREQLFITFPQHVLGAPEKYHWCFYWKLLGLREGGVPAKRLWNELRFLTDVARIFEVDFDEPGYLRQLQVYYRILSQETFGIDLRERNGGP